jgi:hypothetical protein
LACARKTNFTYDEVNFFLKVDFVLNKQQPIHLQSLFGGKNFVPINQPTNAMSWPIIQNGKVVRPTMPFKMSKLHYNWWEGGQLFETTINPPLKVPTPQYG